METKFCSKCNTVKPLTEFAKAKNCVGGYRSQCKPCKATVIREWKKRTGYKPKPEAVERKKQIRKPPDFHVHRRRMLFGKYKITIQEYDLILERQGGVCALCRVPGRANRWGRLSVDHCHETKRVRGLLCAACNTALGMLGDTVPRLERALEYLKGNAFLAEEVREIPLRTNGSAISAQMPDNPQGPGRSAPTRQSDARSHCAAAP